MNLTAEFSSDQVQSLHFSRNKAGICLGEGDSCGTFGLTYLSPRSDLFFEATDLVVVETLSSSGK